MRPINILLGDLAYFNKYTRENLYTPLATGFIATYATQLFGNEVKIKIVKKPEEFLAYTLENRVDLIGMSLYYWNTELNHAVIRKIHKKYKDEIVIAYGGPSIDTDPLEQKRMFNRFPEVNALIPNEGEIGFTNLIHSMLSGRENLWKKSIDGVVFKDHGELISGKDVGLSLDLTTLQSPYLTGFLNDYLTGNFQPLIQTSRLCPYTCAFCVSGKTRGKLRAFSIDQVKEEISYVSSFFKDRPHFTCFISDENFGILSRDIEIAHHIKKCSVNLGYPKSVFFYNDKRFTDTSRSVVETISKINTIGLTLALQTENPETLKAIHRTNLTSEQIDQALSWASERDIPTTTELIFGLPYETKESFVSLLERSVKRGFDSVLCHNLFVMDGIEMNRSSYREKHKMQTKFRVLSSSYGMFEDEFVVESEEVVTATTHFSEEDYFYVRCSNFMFYAVYSLHFYKWFFNYLPQIKISLTEFFYHFLNPDLTHSWPKSYLNFTEDLKQAFRDELFPTKEALSEKMKKEYITHGCQVTSPTRINVRFGARLIYLENGWIRTVLEKILNRYYDFIKSSDQNKIIQMLFDICECERISLTQMMVPDPIMIDYDIQTWKKEKYKILLKSLKIPPTQLKFQLDPKIKQRIEIFNKDFGKEKPENYYYQAFGFIVPRSSLLYKCCQSALTR